MFISGILLAAGNATRMGADKLQMSYKGRRLIDRAIDPLVKCRLIDEVIIVVRPDLLFSVDHPKCRIIVNPAHQEGMGSSLRTGVAAAHAASDAFVVSLADMAELTADLITELIEAFRRARKWILVPQYQRQNGHPVVIAGNCRADLSRLGGDQGARSLILEHPEMVEYFDARHRAVVYDADTPADIALKHMFFDSADALHDAAAALTNAGIYFEDAAAGSGGRMWIGYYPFDEEQVVPLCRGGRMTEPK
jgi:CTP:molybdopterin cytidylyltransferase MocA